MRQCSECQNEKVDAYCGICKKITGNHFVLDAVAGIYKVRLPALSTKHKRPGIKRPLRETTGGYKMSGDILKHPDGIIISRVIDREYNQYEEIITDIKTNAVIRDVCEPLDKHISKAQKSTS
jgi:hypothetical protein